MILLRLREETRAQHEALESALDIFHRCRSLEEYRALLARFYGFYAPVEAALGGREEWPQFGFDYEKRRKTPLLRKDLSALGLSAPCLDGLPLCEGADLPPLTDFAEVLGGLYVFEGATLGGQIIARHLSGRFGLDAENGSAFFRSYGGAVGTMWRSCGALLVRYAAERGEAEEAAMIRSARDTFAAFGRWLA